ncbi:type II toxin-antitoxin system prevent-host-death family antitoxin [Microbacterium sp.]|uniref:type II toxin-antitoxin system prevent-host-death family antitoxin n=1 Tax=Microbacterium sp. TaxID=51671 RepID=UPI003C217B75
MDERTISVGQLRQNPTTMIRAVRAGQHWTVTDRGVPVADVIPHVPRQWTPIGDIAEALRRLHFDGELAAEVDAMRDAETMTDPWSKS